MANSTCLSSNLGVNLLKNTQGVNLFDALRPPTTVRTHGPACSAGRTWSGCDSSETWLFEELEDIKLVTKGSSLSKNRSAARAARA